MKERYLQKGIKRKVCLSEYKRSSTFPFIWRTHLWFLNYVIVHDVNGAVAKHHWFLGYMYALNVHGFRIFVKEFFHVYSFKVFFKRIVFICTFLSKWDDRQRSTYRQAGGLYDLWVWYKVEDGRAMLAEGSFPEIAAKVCVLSAWSNGSGKGLRGSHKTLSLSVCPIRILSSLSIRWYIAREETDLWPVTASIWALPYICFARIVAPVALIEWFVYVCERAHFSLRVVMNAWSVFSPNGLL